jgi:hypothetical protein
MSQILKCTCTHSFQDKMYGRGFRVHTILKQDGQARCTVCGTTHSYSSKVHKEEAKKATVTPAEKAKQSLEKKEKKETKRR